MPTAKPEKIQEEIINVSPRGSHVLLSALIHIEKQTDDRASKGKLNQLIIMLQSGASVEKMNALVAEAFSPEIKGAPNQALLIATAAFFFAFPASIGVNNVLAQTGLSPLMKACSATLSALSGSYGRLQLGIDVNNNGGRDLTLRYLALSLAGILLATAVSESADLSEISTLLDPNTCALLISSLLAGFGLSVFSQLGSVRLWQKEGEADKASAIFGGLSGLSPGIFGFARYALLNAFGAEKGQSAMSALLIASITGPTLLFKYSKLFRLNNSPYHQFKETYGLPMNEALELAKAYGQHYLPTYNEQGDWRAHAEQLKNTSTLITIFNYLMSFGMFLGIASTGTIALLDWNYSHNDALLIVSAFALFSNLCRTATAWPINFLDKDPLGGGLINSISILLTVIGALNIALPEQIPNLRELSINLGLIAAGTGIASAATFKLVTSEIKKDAINPARTPMDSAKTSALISAAGTFGGILYTAGSGVLASENPTDPALGYIEIYYVIAGLSLFSGLLSAYMSLKNRDVLTPSSNEKKSLINYSNPPSSRFTFYQSISTTPQEETQSYGAVEQNDNDAEQKRGIYLV